MTTGFAGFPVQSIDQPIDADVAVLGIPMGVTYPGRTPQCDTAPATIRQQSRRLGRFLTHHDFTFGRPLLSRRPVTVVDCGDVPIVDPLHQHATSTAAVERILAAGAKPLVIGGDHSIPIPVLRAFHHQPPVTVILVDAHIDYRDEVDGEREGLSSGMRRAMELPWVESVVQIGVRGSGSARVEDVEESSSAGCIPIPALDIHLHGVEPMLSMIPARPRYYVSLDMDGFDPSVAPGVGSPAVGGLTYPQVVRIFQHLATVGEVVGMDVVELAPANDVNEITSLLAARIALDTIDLMTQPAD
jgi:agmatinase